MIRYDLICEAGHDFDGWFRDAAAFDKALAAGAVSCTACGSEKVVKALMAPAVATARKRQQAQDKLAALKVAAPDPRQVALSEMLRQVRAHVEATADYVGDRFAEEARKMHYGETEAHGIYGEASPAEAHALAEEGIEVHPLPRLPEEGN
ncbi:hypothetical protein SAMN02745157_4887 [Kaistia soli DSM 19436]|uniref:DUF1178 family protein n=1 Tax=Kaistia soli DSM 19436 TaxID=1122133 RepID=A0A1M5N1D2_9HYPH|nr:DUF1178 family protein [Kaistia soli]SHG83255.1 hypothetical protein SAMN02745157_4887 [Kaistia soli DSM 19436]